MGDKRGGTVTMMCTGYPCPYRGVIDEGPPHSLTTANKHF